MQSGENNVGKKAFQDEGPSKYRKLGPYSRPVVFVLTIGIVSLAVIFLFNIVIFGKVMLDNAYYLLMLASFLALLFLNIPAHPRLTGKLPWYDIVLAVLAFGVPFYMAMNAYEIVMEAWEALPPPFVVVSGTVLLLVVFEGVRRTSGLILMLMAAVFTVYPLFAGYAPGILRGVSYPFKKIIAYAMMGPESLIGMPTQVLTDLLIGFMIFAIVLQITGGGKFFIDLASAMVGSSRGGIGKVACLGSAFFGSLSGSAVANVATTGSFTIPAMKRAGYRPEIAGAIEACASTGGVLMPPVMGATAFVLAQMLNVPYLWVMIAAFVPSILYYLAIFVQIDGYAAKNNLRGFPKEQVPNLLDTLKKGWIYIISFAVLLYFLAYLNRTAHAPFHASIILVALAMIYKETRLDFRTVLDFLERLSRLFSELGGMMAGIGLIIGSLHLVGVAPAFSFSIIEMAGGSVFLLVLYGAIASFVMGMGLTVTACYVILAILLAPALIQFGLEPMAVHLFVMYCGMLSYITPPVAIAAYVASTLAGCSPWNVAYSAMRLGVMLFIVPFLFVLNPGLILKGEPAHIAISIVSAFVAVLLMASGIEGYLIKVGKIGWVVRALIIVVALALFILPIWMIL